MTDLSTVQRTKLLNMLIYYELNTKRLADYKGFIEFFEEYSIDFNKKEYKECYIETIDQFAESSSPIMKFSKKIFFEVFLKIESPEIIFKILNDYALLLYPKDERALKKFCKEYLNPLLKKPNRQMPQSISLPESNRLRKDNPGKPLAFIMMSFGENAENTLLVDMIKETCQKCGIEAFRADDKQYDKLLWKNIEVYMQGCDFGISIFSQGSINENVCLETGYMMALNKPVLMLKDNKTRMPTDLIGNLYKPFDENNIKKTVPGLIIKWLGG